MSASPRTAGIAGLGSCLGERVLTNADLERMVETSDEWIRERTGILRRHILGPGQATSDLVLGAAGQALDRAGVDPAGLDLILVATVTPDHPFPSTACLVQERLGARRAAAFDLQAACSGFIYGLVVADRFIASGAVRTALVVGAESLSRITDYQDRRTCVLFGDGAGAAVVRAAAPGYGILGSHLGSDGSGGHLLFQPAGGSRLPASAETVAQRLHYVQMNGSEVFKQAVRVMDEAAGLALKAAGLRKEDVDLMVPHQANLRIVDAVARRMGMAAERVMVNLDECGNMSSASVPVALDQAVREGRIRRGDVVLLVAFGAGLTWGSVVLRWEGAPGEGKEEESSGQGRNHS
ncbi:MAG: beta-ketoacyl-ACP synthase III [bacterium]|nr:beta-ketoacyl-ACP synthase III [bacterium]